MDQRRVILFVVLSFLVLQLSGLLTPPRPPKKPPAPPAAVDQPAKDEPAENAALEPGKDKPAASELAIEAPPKQDVPLEFVTLGSLDPNSPYRMLVTLTNRGAAVRRIELASPRFRDLHDRSGYLGHLESTADPAGGVRVQVVGAGGPAAKAGLQPGDRVVSISSGSELVSVETPEDLSKFLGRTRPRQKVTLSVLRGDEAPLKLEAALQRRPLEVIRPESENVLMRMDTLPAGVVEPPSFQLTLEQAGEAKLGQVIKRAQEVAAKVLADGAVNEFELPREIAGVELLESNWEIASHDETSVTFRQTAPQFQLEVRKRYRLQRLPDNEIGNINYPGYNFTLEVEIRNLGESASEVAYQLDGPNGLPLEGWWYAASSKVGRKWGAVGIRDVMGRFAEEDPIQLGPVQIATGDLEPMAGKPLAFMGVDAQYFSVMLLPQKAALSEMWLDQVQTILLGPKPLARSRDGNLANVTCRFVSRAFALAQGESLKHSYTVFAGPKRPELLAQYQASNDPYYTLSDLLYYGWFSGVARAMLGILHFFYGIVHNYGIAIILLTVLVRLCLFPVSRKQAQSMAKMQELKPEMEKIKEKYKSDMQKQSQAMQDLYRKYNINPMAGCLPMFIQLPILMGLYRSLMVDVELRQAPLLGEGIRWCSNLAGPDMLWNWSGVMPDFVTSGFLNLGPYLNVLPLVTIVLFLVQQKMFMPEPTNEQAVMQQKMMKYMMVFMGFLFFKVASGLCIYFIASSLWGIGERKLIGSPTTTGAGTTSNTAPLRSTSERNGQRGGGRSGKAKKKR